MGTGKTTVLNKLLEWCVERSRQPSCSIPALSEAEFFDFMMADFGISCDSTMKSRALMKLNQWLLNNIKAGIASS